MILGYLHQADFGRFFILASRAYDLTKSVENALGTILLNLCDFFSFIYWTIWSGRYCS